MLPAPSYFFTKLGGLTQRRFLRLRGLPMLTFRLHCVVEVVIVLLRDLISVWKSCFLHLRLRIGFKRTLFLVRFYWHRSTLFRLADFLLIRCFVCLNKLLEVRLGSCLHNFNFFRQIMYDLDELFHLGVVLHRYWFSDWKVLGARQFIQ